MPVPIDELTHELATLCHRENQDSSRFLHETKRATEAFKADELSLDEIGFWYRATVRALFADLEVLGHWLRASVFRWHEQAGLTLSKKKRRQLSDGSRVPTLRSFTLGFELFPELLGQTSMLDLKEPGYVALHLLYRARERFAHPKARAHIQPYELFASVVPATEWLLHQELKLLLACAAAHDQPARRVPALNHPYSDSLRAGFEELRETIERTDEHRVGSGEVREFEGLLDDEYVWAGGLVTEAMRRDLEGRPSRLDLPLESCLRNFVRVFTTWLEGRAFAAGSRRGLKEIDLRHRLEGDDAEVVRSVLFLLGRTLDPQGADSVRPPEGAFETLVEARALRRRLTHPSSHLDLRVDSSVLWRIHAVWRWLSGN